ncbi:MAG TPA: hypothetical protein VKH62_06945, partial [Candidatus Binatia bacterium]|nr:hypothetical protein [Candidatus Binatia bacterium]
CALPVKPRQCLRLSYRVILLTIAPATNDFFERCHGIGHLALRLYGQRVNVIQEELPFHRQSAGIH